jgi:hypothetical protein
VRLGVPEQISPDVRRFVTERIHSVAELELLLMLHRDPSVEWTAESAGREMRYPAEWVAERLVEFDRGGLVGSRRRGQPTYRYRPRAGLARVVDELADTFSRRRMAVTALIFSGAARDAERLSDAFRLRRKDE